TGTGQASLFAGLVYVSSGTTVFENRGTINVQQGTLNLNVSSGGTFVNRGTVRVDAGANLASSVGLHSDGGTVRGGGSITADVTFTGAGNALRPGPDAAPGTLTVFGNLALNAGTTLFVRLNGTAAGSTHDRLAVSGTVDLGGAALAPSLGG